MKACAFLVHPLNLAHRRLLGARLADRDLMFDRATDRVAEVAKIVVETPFGDVSTHILLVPDLPHSLIEDQQRALALQQQGVAIATQRGATLLGLGSVLAVVAGRGREIASHSPIPITTGMASTAWTCSEVVARSTGDSAVVGVLGDRTTVGRALVERLTKTRRVRIIASTDVQGRWAADLGVEVVDAESFFAQTRDVVSALPTGPTLDPSVLSPQTTFIDLANPSTLKAGSRPPGLVELAGETLTWPGRVRSGVWGRLWRALAGYEHGTAYACLAEPIAMVARNAEQTSVGRSLSPQDVQRAGERLLETGFHPQVVARASSTSIHTALSDRTSRTHARPD